ncbi:diacylglycerol/lipid kinase family protein [Pseudactinotalea suaedae]|uniref:diacylglycerol/lipid kinase family protein n=1 Tax=Pseudactinotalea suaedae TaxID=1524924 RepID=UPI0012E18368|nr:diacylglycerol kinase family protein [Pseudactinotalea suaedae]
MTWEQVVSLAALLVAVVAAVVGVLVLRRLAAAQRRVPTIAPQHAEDQGDRPPLGPAAIIVNPTKVTQPASLQQTLRELSAELGLPEPLWFETSVEDPGHGQALQAMAAGASVVIAAGGDGTVRSVAGALASTSTPMGLLPLGTGNLLARNLDLPLEAGTRALLTTALIGTEHPIDLAWLRTERTGSPPDDVVEPGSPEEHVFLVAGGVGFDAAMVAGADEQLKARMGWLAYFVAGVQHLHGRRIRLTMQVDDQPAVPLRLRSLVFANCGRLPGGMVLLPDAEINDGWLDIAALDARGGLFGWASLFGKVLLQGLGVRRDLPGQPGSIEFWRGRTVTVRCEEPQQIQLDGDLIGEAIGLQVRVQPGSLLIRTR